MSEYVHIIHLSSEYQPLGIFVNTCGSGKGISNKINKQNEIHVSLLCVASVIIVTKNIDMTRL